MQSSYEIRWFIAGAIDRETRDWLTHLPGAGPETIERRSDRYALVSDERFGVKLRDQKLELKWRLRSHQISLGPIAGRIERWQKTESPAEPELEGAPGPFIEIEKRRVQRELEHVAIELVELDGLGCEQFGLALETDGVGRDGRRALLRALDRIKSSVPAPERFRLERSFGYPRWLCACGA